MDKSCIAAFQNIVLDRTEAFFKLTNFEVAESIIIIIDATIKFN